jgi:plasmid maintenance system antidote protein VapI
MVKRRTEARPGWYVAEWLEYLSVSQADVAEAWGRSKGRVSELVCGKQRFNEDDLAAFSRILGVTRGYLLEVNPMTPDGRMHAERGRILPPPPQAPAENKRRA